MTAEVQQTANSRQWFFLALAAVLFWLIYLLAPVITPFVISAALAYLGDPVVDRLERVRIGKWHISRTVAVSLVFVLMTGCVFLILLIVVPLLQEQVAQLVANVPEALEWLAGTAFPWLQAKLGLSSLSMDTEVIIAPSNIRISVITPGTNM